jgi:hypothetical protein
MKEDIKKVPSGNRKEQASLEAQSGPWWGDPMFDRNLLQVSCEAFQPRLRALFSTHQ